MLASPVPPGKEFQAKCAPCCSDVAFDMLLSTDTMPPRIGPWELTVPATPSAKAGEAVLIPTLPVTVSTTRRGEVVIVSETPVEVMIRSYRPAVVSFATATKTPFP